MGQTDIRRLLIVGAMSVIRWVVRKGGSAKPPTLTILIIDTTKSGQQWPRAAVVAIMMIVTLFAVATAALKAAYGRRG